MNCTIEDYSEKAIAVFGDTKPISDRLGSIQGSKFNPCLRGIGENKRPGWIFPKTRRLEVETLLQSIQQEVKSGDFKPSPQVTTSYVDNSTRAKATTKLSSSSSVDSSVLSRIEILEAKVETLTKALSSLKSGSSEPKKTSSVLSKNWADEEDEEEIKPRGLLRSVKK